MFISTILTSVFRTFKEEKELVVLTSFTGFLFYGEKRKPGNEVGLLVVYGRCMDSAIKRIVGARPFFNY